MMRKTRTIVPLGLLGLSGFLLLFGIGRAKAQSSPSPAPAPPPQNSPARPQNPIVTRTLTVIVPVTVKDSHGQLVGDLRKDDFRVFSDSVEQKITGFSSEPVPLSAVVLVDNDLGEKQGKQVQSSLSTISAGFAATDEVALVKYDEYPETVADFSANNDELFTQLKRLEIGTHNTQVMADPTTAGPIVNGHPAPSTSGPALHGSQRYKNDNALNDAIFAAADMLKTRGRDRRKIIFLISDESNSGTNTHSFEETLRALLASDVSVYSISVTHNVPIARSLVQRGASDVVNYANKTGGDTYYSAKQTDLERLYSDVTEQARNEYTLTFSPSDVATSQDYHPIEVRVRRPGLSVDTRDGFYLSAIAAGR